MVKCPVCEKEITSLNLDEATSAIINRSFKATYDEDTNSLELKDRGYEEVVDYKDTLGETFYCPECDSEIANSHDEAVKLLKGDE